MASSTARNQQTFAMRGRKNDDTQWSDLDKSRLYSIGTVIYSALTVALHPLTVIKIRKQTQTPYNSSSGTFSVSNLSQYYRGLSVVVSFAVPARILYISSLELSRELADLNARHYILNPPSALATYKTEIAGLLPLVTPFAGGFTGGVAALSSQLIVVPMDVISQKLMVMEDSVFKEKGGAIKVARSIMKREGITGLYKGFGLSLFTSLPAGSVWWASYAGCKELFSGSGDPYPYVKNDFVRRGIVQVASAFSAAFAASILTQPLDTIKTRLQVGSAGSMKLDSSLLSIVKEISSMRGLYKGLLPRIAHMGIWGSVLSAAYEGLKVVSRKDYEL